VNRTLYYGDNLAVLRTLPDACIDLIYADPPFNSGRDYGAYDDRWASMGAYLAFMAARLVELWRVLKDTGTLYLHCDPTASHYLKVELDKIFRPNNFRNEIIWAYSGGGIPSRDFPRKHDVLLRYSKSDNYTYRPVYRAYSRGTQQRGRTAIKGSATLRVEGTPVTDWWYSNLECDACGHAIGGGIKRLVSPTDRERLGYPTQKPLALLERIVQASSNPGDLILDPFCGCGTAVAAAEKLGRRWIGIDSGAKAIAMTSTRMFV
jgi:site-specific DNA-methyltransferase (adenine-specific)